MANIKVVVNGESVVSYRPMPLEACLAIINECLPKREHLELALVSATADMVITEHARLLAKVVWEHVLEDVAEALKDISPEVLEVAQFGPWELHLAAFMELVTLAAGKLPHSKSSVC